MSYHNYTTSYYDLTISDLEADNGQFFAIREDRMESCRWLAEEAYYKQLAVSIWALVSGGVLPGEDGAAGGITIDGQFRTDASPSADDVTCWAEEYISAAERAGKHPAVYCRSAEELGEWLEKNKSRLLRRMEADDVVEAAFDELQDECRHYVTVWCAAAYGVDGVGIVDPAPSGWETCYVVESELWDYAYYNIYPAGKEDDSAGKWIVAETGWEPLEVDEVDDVTAAFLSAAVFAAVTDTDGRPLTSASVYVYREQGKKD